MRELIANLALLSTASGILITTNLIRTEGSVTIIEPNRLILHLELGLLIGLVLFALVNIILWVRRKPI